MGTDFAGEVESIGKNVKSFSIGDKVFGFNDTGSQSQAAYIITTVENLFPIPGHKLHPHPSDVDQR